MVCNSLSRILCSTLIPRHKRIDFELPLTPRIIHIPNLPKNRPLLPSHIMNTHNRPTHPHKPIRIVPIIRIPIIKILRRSQSILRTHRPFQNLLRPIHSHKPVHAPLSHQLQLRRIPQIIVSLGFFQLSPIVQIFPLVRRMQFQTLSRPIRRSGEVIVSNWTVVHEIIAEFSSDDSFFDVSGRAVGMFFERSDLEGQALEGDLTVIDPRGEVGADVWEVGVVAMSVEVFESLLGGGAEFLEAFHGGFVARRHSFDGLDRWV
mmetsp:Transcript_30769/g.64250  ORF Transcript_30769/g.64250 Transcript_30769/m.64250 type:complete len:261 (-) Transcript_30769:1555-2337(-)